MEFSSCKVTLFILYERDLDYNQFYDCPEENRQG